MLRRSPENLFPFGASLISWMMFAGPTSTKYRSVPRDANVIEFVMIVEVFCHTPRQMLPVIGGRASGVIDRPSACRSNIRCRFVSSPPATTSATPLIGSVSCPLISPVAGDPNSLPCRTHFGRLSRISPHPVCGSRHHGDEHELLLPSPTCSFLSVFILKSPLQSNLGVAALGSATLMPHPAVESRL